MTLRMLFHRLGFHRYQTVGRYWVVDIYDQPNGHFIYQRRCSICGKFYETKRKV